MPGRDPAYKLLVAGSMTLKILATADIHVGRRPSKVGDAEDAARFSCARAWLAIVQRAIALEVDLVMLAGDVVDHANRFFEATGPLEDGLARLAEAGIPTYAVAGNHDWDVLPRIVEAIGPEYFRLLGRQGRWEEAVYRRGGRERLRIHGWSFPAATFDRSPLSGYNLSTAGELPVVGLLHGDLDARASRYGPLSRSELEAHHVSLWVLGHVHAARLERSEAAALLYPGSPQAMDPGETGRHGPWLIEVQSRGRLRARQLPMSKVRYDLLPVDLTGVATREDFETHLAAAAGDRAMELADGDDRVEYISLRIVLTGRTPLCSRLDDLAAPVAEQFERRRERVTARIETVRNETLPAIELKELAAKRDPTGALARLILDLRGGGRGAEARELVERVHGKMLEVHAAPAYDLLHTDPAPDPQSARDRLLRQAGVLLDTLLTQERAG